jgi:predicted site-specific integrase-resolvase
MKRELVATSAEPSRAGNQTEPEGFLTSQQLAARLQVSIGTLRNWRASGKLAYIVTPGRSVRYWWPTIRDTLIRTARGGVS